MPKTFIEEYTVAVQMKVRDLRNIKGTVNLKWVIASILIIILTKFIIRVEKAPFRITIDANGRLAQLVRVLP